MKSNTYLCDVCRKPRSEDANHWWLVSRGGREIILQPWAGAKAEDIEQADFHLCGESDLIKKVSELCAAPVKVLEGVN